MRHDDGDHPIDVPALQPHHDGREEEGEQDRDRQGHEQILRQAQDGHDHDHREEHGAVGGRLP